VLEHGPGRGHLCCRCRPAARVPKSGRAISDDLPDADLHAARGATGARGHRGGAGHRGAVAAGRTPCGTNGRVRHCRALLEESHQPRARRAATIARRLQSAEHQMIGARLLSSIVSLPRRQIGHARRPTRPCHWPPAEIVRLSSAESCPSMIDALLTGCLPPAGTSDIANSLLTTRGVRSAALVSSISFQIARCYTAPGAALDRPSRLRAASPSRLLDQRCESGTYRC
jgi:hypothetical protein